MTVQRASARLLSEIRTSHTVYSYVDVISPTQERVRLPATGGAVNCDRTAAVRRTCKAVCIDPLGTLVPSGTSSLLTPYGTELRPYRGVRYAATPEHPEGEIDVLPLGVFRLAKVTIHDTTGGSPDIQLEAYDLSRTVARDKFTSPYVIPVGTNVIDAIKAILQRTFPDLQYDAISTTRTTTAPRLYDVSNDPWSAVTDLATSLGCDIYFDVEGGVVIAPPADIDALPSPDFTYIEGQRCTMIDLSRVFTDEPGFNGIVLTGESPGDQLPPVRAVAWDEEPTSATYHLGPYGEVPQFITDQLIKTTEEAQATADQLLRNLLGFSAQLSITGVVNPSFEAGQVVAVTRARSHVTGVYAVDAFTVPLDAKSTQALTLRQKSTAGGT
ncbi:DUF5047 domain-containing protein [Streptomyces sp. OK228]|uniref:DUF5047 domain-containing protein n=1 Tax=Streptomyces sp. OK228 TaxID=1882786 RepID=UPI000BDC83FB|nr:DUF5047 domain-containing protein [Streptomyces sp. OK228]SOE25601.1 protein of unknown function [Streptomyces sp. OK228]